MDISIVYRFGYILKSCVFIVLEYSPKAFNILIEPLTTLVDHVTLHGIINLT